MKAKQVIYSRLISKGNFENEKIEVCLEVEEGEKLNDVFNAAKKFVDLKVDAVRLPSQSIDKAKMILLDKDNYTGKQVREAQELIDKHTASEIDDLPF